MTLTPDELSGHALGLHSSGMLAMQGVGAALAGAIAQQTSAATAMAVMAAASPAVTVALAPGLRNRPAAAGRNWDTPSAMTFRPSGDRPEETLLGWDGREDMVSAGHHDQLSPDAGGGERAVPGLSLPGERAAPGVQQEHGRADIAGAGHGRRGVPPPGHTAGVATEPAGLHSLALRVEQAQVGDRLAAHSHPEAMVASDDAAGQVPAVAVPEQDQRAWVGQSPGGEQVHAGQHIADLRILAREAATAEGAPHLVAARDAGRPEVGHEHRPA